MSTAGLRATVLTCIFCLVLVGPVSAFMIVVDQQDIARANMPVTSMPDLTVGALVKVNGTMWGARGPVLDAVGSGDTLTWRVSPFNVSDASGSIYVDPSDLDGSNSYRVIRSGIHDGDWWSGDPVAVIGTVLAWPNGTSLLRASYIARTPNGFYTTDLATSSFIGMGAVAAVVGTAAAATRIRRVRAHGRNAPHYTLKTTADLLCGACGAPLAASVGTCPQCGALTNLASTPPSATDIDGLPSLRLVVRFSERDRSEKVGVIGLGIVLPILLLALGVWLYVGPGPKNVMLPITALIFGIGLAVAFANRFFVRETVTLAPTLIEVHRGLYRATAVPKDVRLILTVHRRSRRVHGVVAKGGQAVFFGPGLARADFEHAREWLRALAQSRGVVFQEDVDYTDLPRLLAADHNGPK